MEEEELNPELVAKAILGFQEELGSGTQETIGTFARLQDRLAEGLADGERHLAATLGERGDAEPRIVALRHLAESAAAVSRALTEFDLDHRETPRVRTDQVLVYGRVQDRDGKPAAGVSVGVSGRATAGEFVGRERTDDQGRFRILFDAAHLDRLGEGGLLTVADKRGKGLLEVETSLGNEGRTAHYFDVVLPPARGGAKRA
jgi:hypothetical protein